VILRIDRIPALPAIGARRGTLLCLHAMMTDGRYFGARRPADASFAAAFAAAGFDVLVADFRGHGRSVPPRAGPDDWSFDDLVELDLPALVAAAGPGELVILGHSLGGLVALAALGTGRIPAPHSVLLPSTAPWLGGPLHRRAVMAAYGGVAALLGRAPIRALRLGTADESATYVRQLTGWARAGRWTSLAGVDYLRAIETIETPVLPIAGGADWMCTPRDAADFAGRIPGAAPLRVVDGADHFQLFTRPAHRAHWDAMIAASLPLPSDHRVR